MSRQSRASIAIGVTMIKSKCKWSQKQYRNEIKASLDGFTKTREWADLIQNLSKLHKVLTKFSPIHVEYNEAMGKSPSSETQRHRVLPHTVQVCKVLAMCLTPGRPAGVHLKAIEVYQAVFQNLSRENLIADLGLWLCGLLPLASFASTRVRPVLLKLLQQYIISLGEPCRVALDGIIAALLPCIEELNTALYSQAMELLDELAQNGLPFFFSALLRTICSCSHVRIPATHYLNLLFKDKTLRIQCLELCKSNDSLVIQAWLAVLRDAAGNVLAKRNVLDLLIAHFPLEQALPTKLDSNQVLCLVHGLLPVMLFREVSVNRRIYSWFLNLRSTTNEMDPNSVPSSSRSRIPNPSGDDQDQDLDTLDTNNSSIPDNDVVDAVDSEPRLSEFAENVITDAFRLYLDRSGDIHSIHLLTVPPLSAYPLPVQSSPRSVSHHSEQLNHDNSVTMDSPRSVVSRRGHSYWKDDSLGLPLPGLDIFRKLTIHETADTLNAEEFITSPLNLLKILIDRNEIRSSQLVQRVHGEILEYAYSFEPHSMADPTNLEAITCFQAVIQSTQLIYAQIDTHRTIKWLRQMLESKYADFVQITTLDHEPEKGTNSSQVTTNTTGIVGNVGKLITHFTRQSNDSNVDVPPTEHDETSGPQSSRPRLQLSVAIPAPKSVKSNDAQNSSLLHSHWTQRRGTSQLTLMRAIELIDFALDFIPIVSHREEMAESIARDAIDNQKGDSQDGIDNTRRDERDRKYSTVDKDVAALVGDILSKLHTLLIGETRIQGIRFCLKLIQRLGKKATSIPDRDIVQYLNHSVPSIPSLEYIQAITEDANEEKEDDKHCDQGTKSVNDGSSNLPTIKSSRTSPRTEMHNRLELEVIELNFQLLTIVIEAQTKEEKVKALDGPNPKTETIPENTPTSDSSRTKALQSSIVQHLEFAQKCVYHCKTEQMVVSASTIWLKLITSYTFLPRHVNSCKRITQRLWDLIQPSKSSATNYQIAQLISKLAEIQYTTVEKVISQSLITLQNASQHHTGTVLAEGYQRFCTLYRIIGEIDHLRFYWSEIVYIMLAACDDDRPLIHNIATQWLTESLSLPPRVLDPMIMELLESSTQTNPIGPEIYQYQQWYDPRLASDTLKKLLSIVQSMGPKLIESCKNCGLTTNVVDRLLLHGCLLSADHLQAHLQSVMEKSKRDTLSGEKVHNPNVERFTMSSGLSSLSTNQNLNQNQNQNQHDNGRQTLSSPTRYELIRSKKRMELKVSRTSSLYLPEFQCRDYLDVMVLIGLKYIRGDVHEKTSGDLKNSSLRVRTVAIEFLRRFFQQFGDNLRSAKLASSITSTIVHQLSIAISQKQFLLQIELLSLLSTLIKVTYRRVDPAESPSRRTATKEYIERNRSTNATSSNHKGTTHHNSNTHHDSTSTPKHHKHKTSKSASTMESHQNKSPSHRTLYISEPDIFSSSFFTNTVIAGISQSCKLRMEDMQIQLYPLRHFLEFCNFLCDYIKKGLPHFVSTVFQVLCTEVSTNHNTQHMQQLLTGESKLLRKLIRDPNQSKMQLNDDTDFNAGTWMVHILTFGLATSSTRKPSGKSSKSKGSSHGDDGQEMMQRPAFLNEAEQQLFRLFPQMMQSLCVAWGRTQSSFGEENRGFVNSVIGSSDDPDDRSLGPRRNSLNDVDLQHSTSRRHRRELDELHVRHIQQQIVDLVAPFFAGYSTLVFVAMLNNWEKALNTSNVWALRMSTVRRNSRGSLSDAAALSGDFPEHHDQGTIILNYGGHTVLSRECEHHKNVLNLLDRLSDSDHLTATDVIQSVCDIASANMHKQQVRGGSMLVRINECTPLHFMYYYIHSCSALDDIVTIWPSIQKYFEAVLAHNESPPMNFLWILSILQLMIERVGSKLMNHKMHKKSFITMTKAICVKIAEIAGHREKYEVLPDDGSNRRPSKFSPMSLPPILFFIPSRPHQSNDFPPLPDWIVQLLESTSSNVNDPHHLDPEHKHQLLHQQHANNAFISPRPLTPLPPAASAPLSRGSNPFDDQGSRTQEHLSQRVYNSHIPRVYSSPTLGVSLAAVRVLANMGALFVHQVFKNEWHVQNAEDMKPNEADINNNINSSTMDTDGIHSLLYQMISNVSPILTMTRQFEDVSEKQTDGGNQRQDLSTLLSFLNGYASILSSLSVQQYRSHSYKTYIRDAWNYFLSERFFTYCDISTLQHWQWIIGSVIECDKSKLKYELLNNPTSTINTLFNKHQTDVEMRRKQLKRLAFVIHSGRRDQYGRYLNAILEKLVESLKIHDATRLYSQVFVCLRVLLTRIDVTNLSPIWPLIITETIRAFEKSSDGELLLSVCKFVDTALILLPQTFQLFKWSFIQDSSVAELLRKYSASIKREHSKSAVSANGGGVKAVFVPHLQLLAKRLEHQRRLKAQLKDNVERRRSISKSNSKSNADRSNEKPSVISDVLNQPMNEDVGLNVEDHEDRKSVTHNRSGIFGNGISPKNKKRPILLMRSIDDVSELIPFHRIVSSLHQRQSQSNDVDHKFLDDLIRSDFIESDYFPNPLLQDIREPSPF